MDVQQTHMQGKYCKYPPPPPYLELVGFDKGLNLSATSGPLVTSS